ncbi:MAG: GNAT family N-acetyltransferase [Flavobacteriaceae bacterium]
MISFQHINNQFQHVFQLASEIWNDNYKGIISQNQIDYMLNMMYNPERLQQDLEEGYQWEFISYNNEIVGYLAYTIKNDNRVFLSKIYLKTTAQGLGIGKTALEHVKNYAKTNNTSAVYLTVNKRNIKGMRAYQNTGFTIIDEEITNIGQGYVMDDYVFEYKIT